MVIDSALLMRKKPSQRQVHLQKTSTDSILREIQCLFSPHYQLFFVETGLFDQRKYFYFNFRKWLGSLKCELERECELEIWSSFFLSSELQERQTSVLKRDTFYKLYPKISLRMVCFVRLIEHKRRATATCKILILHRVE